MRQQIQETKSNSFFSGRKKLLLSVLSLILTTACIIALLSTGSFGAFINEGSLKGVAGAGTYFFTSNILRNITAIADAEAVTYGSNYINGTGTQMVYIWNYDSNSTPNTVEVEFDITFKLSKTDESRSYTVEYTEAGTAKSQEITTTEFKLEKQALPANQKSTQSYNINVSLNNGETDSTDTLAGVIITAVPTTPDYMKGELRGVTVVFNQFQQQFSAVGSFEDTDVALSNLAGFIYNIVPAGYGTEPQITVTWQSDKIYLSTYSQYATSSADYVDNFKWTINTTGNVTTLEITARPGWNFDNEISLTFYRTESFPETTEFPETAEVTMAHVADYVNLTYKGGPTTDASGGS